MAKDWPAALIFVSILSLASPVQQIKKKKIKKYIHSNPDEHSQPHVTHFGSLAYFTTMDLSMEKLAVVKASLLFLQS